MMQRKKVRSMENASTVICLVSPARPRINDPPATRALRTKQAFETAAAFDVTLVHVTLLENSRHKRHVPCIRHISMFPNSVAQ